MSGKNPDLDNQATQPRAKADRVAAARAKAEQFISSGSAAHGTMVGLSPSCKGYWFVPHELGEGRSTSLRADLEARGYEVNKAARVVNVTGAEVWEIPEEVAALHKAARRERDAKEYARHRLDSVGA